MSSEQNPPGEHGGGREADIYDLLAWLEVNKTKVGIIATVLVVLGFAIAAFRYFKDQKEGNASAELLALKPTLTPQTNAPPPQPSAFLKISEQFPGTSAAERAQIFAATTLFDQGKYADAEREFNAFSTKYPESPWAAQAAYGVGASREAQNKLDQAQSTYQNVITAYANSWVVDQARLSLARVYELRKQPEQALRLYNELLMPRPGALPGEGGNRDAFERKEALLRAYPNLNTNLVAAASRPVTLPQTTAQTNLTNRATTPTTNTVTGTTQVVRPLPSTPTSPAPK
ncbi:MAG TPA: tetratricopeptide repeat protein [Verrucomicrobiae bacterium]|nr:tetratricopeptide repeat protein [Verrucomicrobiae bacterium]